MDDLGTERFHGEIKTEYCWAAAALLLTDVNDISTSSTEIQNENHQLCEIKVREWSLFPQATYLWLITN